MHPSPHTNKHTNTHAHPHTISPVVITTHAPKHARTHARTQIPRGTHNTTTNTPIHPLTRNALRPRHTRWWCEIMISLCSLAGIRFASPTDRPTLSPTDRPTDKTGSARSMPLSLGPAFAPTPSVGRSVRSVPPHPPPSFLFHTHQPTNKRNSANPKENSAKTYPRMAILTNSWPS